MEMSLLLTHKSHFFLQMCPYFWFWQVGNYVLEYGATDGRIARSLVISIQLYKVNHGCDDIIAEVAALLAIENAGNHDNL